MYQLMKKHSKEKETSQQPQHVPSQLLNLLDEGARREEEYLKIIQSLRSQKEDQAKQYIEKLNQFSKHLQQLITKKQQQNHRKQFKSFKLRRQEQAKHKPKRTYGKKQYTIEDSNRFTLQIQVKFLFFTPIIQDPLSSYYPKKLQIKFDSLGLNFNSGKISFGGNQQQQQQMLSQGYPFVLQSSQYNKKVCYTLSLQISETYSRSKLQQLMLSLKKSLIQIQVWDFDSKILYGLSYVSLQQLLFYDKAEDYWVQQVDVFSPLINCNVGKLDIEFRNYKSPAPENSVSSVVVDRSNQKLKVTSTTPLQPQLSYDIRSEQEKERRMKRRINHSKQQSMKLGKSVYLNFEFDYLSNQMNSRKLDHILKLKQSQKFNFSEEVLAKIQHQYQSYECCLGNPLLIPIQFTNRFDQIMIFQLIPSQYLKQLKHISILTDSVEIQSYQREYKLVGQPAIIDPYNLTFTLNPSETVFILVKHLTWNYAIEKPLEINIINTYNNQNVQTFVFKVKSTPQRIDHNLRIFEGEGVTTELTIPFQQTNEYSQPYLYCLASHLTFAWNINNFSVRLKVDNDQQVLVYLYDSKQCRRLLKCYKIIVKAFTIYQLKNLQVGLEKTIQLEIPPVKQVAQVKFYSSDSQKVWTNINKTLKLKPNTIETINATVRTFCLGDQNIILSCNKVSGQIIYQWLLKLRVSKPVYKSTIQIMASTNRKSAYTFQLQNPSNRTQALGLVSSNLSFVQIVQNKKVLNGGKMAFIPLVILPHNEGQKQIILNVSNFDQSLNQNHLLQLKFTSKYQEKEQNVQQIVYRRY